MKTECRWSREWYRPAVHGNDTIYIHQVIPQENRITLAWYPENEGEAVVYLRERGNGERWREFPTAQNHITLSGLQNGIDYEFYIGCGRNVSAVGYARPNFVPGITVNYLHPEDPKYAFSGQHLCTPCLLRHPDGYLLASMDLFDGGAPQNLTLIFRSDDNGATWYHYSELFPCFWGTLFLHRGDVYMLAVSTEYGDLLIGRSEDGGKTFGVPTVLARGSCHRIVAGWHKSSMPVLEYAGRLWCGVDYGSHSSGGHASCLLSVNAESDLMQAKNWSITDPLVYDPNWKGAVKGDTRGFIEGNAIPLPEGGVGSFLRYSTNQGTPKFGLAPILKADSGNPEKTLVFDRFVAFPGNLSKFDVKYDQVSRKYYSIVSRIYDENKPGARNVLSLAVSENLEDWRVVCDLLNYQNENEKLIGFQYVSFIFDGDDILYLSRTAFNGAQSYHDNNYVTFHRISDFRKQNEI